MPNKKKKNAKEMAYDYIKERIINGEYAPNTKIDDTAIASNLGISRMPIREAIQMLVAQNFLKSSPKVGTTVTEINLEDIFQLYEPLALMHGLAAKTACLRAKAEDISHMENLNQELKKAVETKQSFEVILNLDMQFHNFVLELAGNPYIIKISEELYMQIERIEYLFLEKTLIYPYTYIEHGDIIKAIKKGDETKAATLMEENWINIIRNMNISSLSRLVNILK